MIDISDIILKMYALEMLQIGWSKDGKTSINQAEKMSQDVPAMRPAVRGGKGAASSHAAHQGHHQQQGAVYGGDGWDWLFQGSLLMFGSVLGNRVSKFEDWGLLQDLSHQLPQHDSISRSFAAMSLRFHTSVALSGRTAAPLVSGCPQRARWVLRWRRKSTIHQNGEDIFWDYMSIYMYVYVCIYIYIYIQYINKHVRTHSLIYENL